MRGAYGLGQCSQCHLDPDWVVASPPRPVYDMRCFVAMEIQVLRSVDSSLSWVSGRNTSMLARSRYFATFDRGSSSGGDDWKTD